MDALSISKITITETPLVVLPSFTFTNDATTIKCGSTTDVTFAVIDKNNAPGIFLYNWDLGSNNGWLINGSPAPASFSTNSNSIKLTTQSTTTLPSTITVTPVYNNTNQSPLTSTVTLSTPSYGIGGGNNICSGTSQPFYIYYLPTGCSIIWSTTTSVPMGLSVVQVDNPNSLQTTLTKIGDGIVNLIANVTNSCGQKTTTIRNNITVGSYVDMSTLSGYTLATPPCYTQGCSPTPVSNPINVYNYYGSPTVYSGTAYLNTNNALTIYNPEVATATWSYVSGSISSWQSSNGNYLQVYPAYTDPIVFRLTKINSCGVQQHYDFTFHPTQYNPIHYYLAFPNPTSGNISVAVDEEKLIQEKLVKSNDQDIKEITILDKMGIIRRKETFGKGTRQMLMNVADLQKGIYIIKIFHGKEYSSLKFIKE